MESTICPAICSSSSYWAPYLTATFGFHIAEQCYVVYVVFLNRQASLDSRILFLLTLISLASFFFAIIRQCALVVKQNGAITRANRSFYYLAFGSSTKNEDISKVQANLVFQLKAEALLLHIRLHPYAFK